MRAWTIPDGCLLERLPNIEGHPTIPENELGFAPQRLEESKRGCLGMRSCSILYNTSPVSTCETLSTSLEGLAEGCAYAVAVDD